MKLKNFESGEEITQRVKNEINKMGDSNFDEKFERVKPALQERGFYPKDEEKEFPIDSSFKKIENQQKIDKVREDLASLNKPSFPKNPLEGEPAERIKTTAEIERDMFKPENIKKRAQNRLQFFRKPMPTKEESDRKLLEVMSKGMEEKKNRLVKFWDSINKEKEL